MCSVEGNSIHMSEAAFEVGGIIQGSKTAFTYWRQLSEVGGSVHVSGAMFSG